MSRVRVLFNNETFLGIVRATLGLFALAALVESDALPAVVRVRTAVYSAVQQFWLDSIVYYDASPPKALAMLILITHMVQVCWLLCVAISAYASLLTRESAALQLHGSVLGIRWSLVRYLLLPASARALPIQNSRTACAPTNQRTDEATGVFSVFFEFVCESPKKKKKKEKEKEKSEKESKIKIKNKRKEKEIKRINDSFFF